MVFKKFFIKVFCTRCMDDLDELGEGDSKVPSSAKGGWDEPLGD